MVTNPLGPNYLEIFSSHEKFVAVVHTLNGVHPNGGFHLGFDDPGKLYGIIREAMPNVRLPGAVKGTETGLTFIALYQSWKDTLPCGVTQLCQIPPMLTSPAMAPAQSE